MKLTDLKLNENNPRFIKDEQMAKLLASIEQFPKMMELRPIVVDENNVILGGNMRYRALVEMGKETIPANWVRVAKGLTEEQKKEFIIKDNASFGMWDMETLANEWPEADLDAWGVNIDFPDIEKVDLEMDDDDKTKTFITEVMVLRNQIAEKIQADKEILISDAYLEAETTILEMLQDYYKPTAAAE